MQNNKINAQAYIDMTPKAKKDFNKRLLTMVREEYLACLFIAQAHGERYGDLKKPFINNGLKGNMKYPKTLEAALLLLKGWKTSSAKKRNQDDEAKATNKVGVAFAQPGTGKLDKHDCYSYDKRGHHVRHFLKLSQKEKDKLYEE